MLRIAILASEEKGGSVAAVGGLAAARKKTLNAVRLLMRTRHVNGLLIAAILLISTAPLYAQRQQQNVAKLKADARNLVGIIGSDKTKTQTYCQIHDLSEQSSRLFRRKTERRPTHWPKRSLNCIKKWVPNLPL